MDKQILHKVVKEIIEIEKSFDDESKKQKQTRIETLLEKYFDKLIKEKEDAV